MISQLALGALNVYPISSLSSWVNGNIAAQWTSFKRISKKEHISTPL